jgi:hypothetical protein
VIERYIGTPSHYPESTFWYSTLGAETKFLVPINNINLGLGCSLRYAGGYFHFKLKDAFKPAFFGAIEIGNGNKRLPLSLSMNIGIMKGTMSNENLGFVSIGPKFNIGKYHKKVNISIAPNLTFHQNENVELLSYNFKVSTPYWYTYNVIYRSLSFNLGITIEINKLKTKHNKG